MTREEKIAAISKMTSKLEKSYGKGSVMLLGEKPNQDIESISTGSIGLDIALGVGGLPKGRVVEIYGPESSGKTTLCIHVMAEAQKLDGFVGIIDVEHAFDKQYASNLGVNVDQLYFSQPSTGEEALEILDNLLETKSFDVLVLDSVAALVPKAELDGEMGDSKMGLQARMMSQAMRKITAKVKSSNTLVIFTNQLREKIGVMFGPSEVTSGGNALKYYSSVRLDIRRSTQIKDGDQSIGSKTRVRVVKNKVAPPFTSAEFDIMFGQGISKAGEILDYGVELDVVDKSGSWYSYGETRLGQGRDTVKQILVDNPELMEEIETKIREQLK